MRSVVRTHRFEAELQDLIPHTPSADEFIESAEFVVARNPTVGCRLDLEGNVWYMPMAMIGDTQIAIYYTFDPEVVYLLSIGRV